LGPLRQACKLDAESKELNRIDNPDRAPEVDAGISDFEATYRMMHRYRSGRAAWRPPPKAGTRSSAP